MKKATKALALLLAGTMVFGTVAGCGGSSDNGEAVDNGANSTETASKDNGATSSDGSIPLVYGTMPLSAKFSPFFANTSYDQAVVDLTQVGVLTEDRAGGIVYNGIEGETIPYNGTDYTYYGLSDVTVNKDDAANTTTYNIKIRDDVTFSDGEPLTIDDVIFTYYVMADTDFDGGATFGSQKILGMENYRANSTIASTISDDEVNAALKDMPEELAAQIQEGIVNPVLADETAWCADVYEAQGAASAEEFFVACYGKDESYSADGKDMETILADIQAQYGADYAALATNYAGDETYFDEDAFNIAKTYVIDQKKAAGEGEEVPNIEGIQRVNDYEVNVVAEGYEATTIYQLGVQVAPLHYYGDKDLYDYENNSFGFTRGDLSAVREKTANPMGAGPYKFVKYENKIVYFEKNDNYFLGAPKIANVQFKETDEADKIPGVQQGTIDISDPSASKAALEQISGINPEGEIVGSVIETRTTDFLGYGYIGICANTVNVAGEPGSDASKNLRKALATVIAAQREVALDSYYGDAADVIQYPISNTSWAAPQKSDADYQEAYSVDVDGNPIFTEGMSSEEKSNAATEAALGFFEAAGYTVADGKVTAAPEGAKLEYEIIIPADGKGDHPTFAVLTDAKAAFETIGITLDINDPSDPNELWNALDADTAELWCAAWGATVDPDMYQVYHSSNVTGSGTNSNHYDIADPELDSMIMEARTSDDQSFRKALYKECLNTIMDWGVEIPVYQRQECIIFSSERVNMDTVTPDMTPFYKWYSEIDKFEMN